MLVALISLVPQLFYFQDMNEVSNIIGQLYSQFEALRFRHSENSY